jgi:Flp pilus assembly protein TadD
MGNIHLKMGNKAEALRAWERSLEIDPNNTIVRNNLKVIQK